MAISEPTEGRVDLATSVGGAFATFRQVCVDLDADEVSKARVSRDNLQQQIAKLAIRDTKFPQLATTTATFVASGSFARSTKIQPLNDIDFFVVMSAADLGFGRPFFGPRPYYLKPQGSTSALAQLTGTNGHVNSTSVLNKFKTALASVPNYASADIHKNGEAVSLKLSSYPWVFDIVPAVALINRQGKVDSYLMPDSKGHWMRSDPRMDSASATKANQRHNGLLLPLIRLVKYWNDKRLRRGISSYYVETVCLKVFENQSPITSLQQGLETFFRSAPSQVRDKCPDPKGFGPNLDQGLDWQTKNEVTRAMQGEARAVRNALWYEGARQVSNALDAWGSVFGTAFPRYG
jgi:hypothetical protein